MGIDPLTKQQDVASENINLIKQVPKKMGPYDVTYLYDSAGHETGKRFYHLLFQKKDTATKKITESFVLNPDVYLMKNNNMSSNPDTKNYLSHDVFTYISYALSPDREKDTASFKVHEVTNGDTIFYSKGYMVLDDVVKNPASNKFHIPLTGPAVTANLSITSNEKELYKAAPMILIDSMGINQIDDTVYGQNLYIKFAGVSSDQKKIKIAVKESEKMIDFVTLKAYIFPYINLVWIGLVVMAIGLIMSMVRRANMTSKSGAITLVLVAAGLFYMFLLANA
jgi:cytochrome c-type biogenesis protein CcmF